MVKCFWSGSRSPLKSSMACKLVGPVRRNWWKDLMMEGLIREYQLGIRRIFGGDRKIRIAGKVTQKLNIPPSLANNSEKSCCKSPSVESSVRWSTRMLVKKDIITTWTCNYNSKIISRSWTTSTWGSFKNYMQAIHYFSRYTCKLFTITYDINQFTHSWLYCQLQE